MPAYRRVVVVGASLAGLRAVEGLRRRGHDKAITVVGAEVHRPYDRPPLSKHLLTGRVGPGDIALPLAANLDVEWRLGSAATGVDLTRRTVLLDDGEVVPFDGLLVATGAHARTLSGMRSAPDMSAAERRRGQDGGRPSQGRALGGLAGVHLLRTLDDAIALRSALEQKPRVAVIGAGFIGLEVAASSRSLGLEVSVLEVASVPLAAAVGPYVGGIVAELHRDHGVDLRVGVGVEGAVGADRVEGVRLTGGEVIPADIVVVGVGASPTTGWLQGSGIDLEDGVRADGCLRALSGGRPLPFVVAAGDVVRWDQPGTGAARVEHWTNAVEQGEAAATTLLLGDEAEPFAPVPYFWSDHYDRKVQMMGRAAPGDEVSVVDGSIDERRFVAAYGREGRLVAAVGFSRPAKVMAFGRRIAAGEGYPPEM